MRADDPSNVLSFAIGRALLRPPAPGSLAATLANIDAVRATSPEKPAPKPGRSFIADLNEVIANIDTVFARHREL